MTEDNVKQSWWQMTSIQIGGAICLPMIMIGQELARSYGFAKAAAAIVIGNFLLFLLGLVKVKMAYENKKTTINNAKEYFDTRGIKFFALNMIISLLGWFAIQLNLITLSVQTCLQSIFGLGSVSSLEYKVAGINILGPVALNIIFGAIITIVATRGIRALNKLSDVSMPVLCLVIGYTLYKALVYGQPASVPVVDSFRGISLVLAGSLLVIVDAPTYYRFSRSLKESYISIFVTMVLATTMVELAGTYIAIRMHGANILETLTLGSSVGYQIFILLFLVLAGWTTNNANLYSCAVTLESIYKKLTLAKSILIVGFLGTILSCFDLIKNFETVLSLMGIFVSAMGAVVAVRYISKLFIPNLPKAGAQNLFAWGCGVLQGFLVFYKIFAISGIEIIDAFLVAAFVSLIQVLLCNPLVGSKSLQTSKHDGPSRTSGG